MSRRVAALLVAAATASCGPGTSPAAPPTAGADRLVAEACPEVERPALQTGSHLIGDAEPPVEYSSTPASSGWHSSGVPKAGVHADPLTDPEIVSLLEAGVVVVAHAPDAAPDPDLAQRLVDQFPDTLAITPYADPMPTDVALLTWGVVARCSTVAADAVTEFVVDWRAAPDADAH